MSKSHRVAVIPGDGIGTEVAPEGLRVLDAAASASTSTSNTSTSTTPPRTTTPGTAKCSPTDGSTT